MKKENLKIHLELKKLHTFLRDRIKKKWDRVLPFEEEITDRWEKAKYLNFGKGTSIYGSSLVFGDVKVGENSWIGPFTILDGSGGLEIGSNCSVSSGVQIYSHDSLKWALSGGKEKYVYAKIKIGNYCYIGPNVIISKGVTIGDYCVIGANSLVNKSIPNYSIVFGAPCKIVGKIIIGKNGEIRFKYNKNFRKSF